MNTIASKDLRPSDIPPVDASITELISFAHTFDGYKAYGSFERCAEIANAQDHSTLDNLRTCLFFEARRWRHFGHSPDAEAQAYWCSIVTKIRNMIENKNHEV